MNGLKGSVKSFVLLNLDSDSSFGDLDNLLARYSMHDQHESSFDSLQDIAQRHVRFRSLDSLTMEAKEKRGKEKETASLTKKKVKLILPSLQPTEARGSHHSFQQESFGAA